MKVIKIEPCRRPEVIDLDESKQLHVAMREAIGCKTVEVVNAKKLGVRYCIVCDEEFLLKHGQQINPLPSYLYGYCEHGHPICGTVLVMKKKETPEGIDLVGFDSDFDLDVAMGYLNSKCMTAYVKVAHTYIWLNRDEEDLDHD